MTQGFESLADEWVGEICELYVSQTLCKQEYIHSPFILKIN